MIQTDKEPRTYALVHGAWHGAWCWDYLRPYLKEAGHKVVAVDLPIEDPKATFDDYATIVKDSLAGHSNIYLVGHSRGGNVIPRVANLIRVERLIYLCAPLPPFLNLQDSDVVQKAPKRNFPEFLRGIIQLDDGLTRFDPATAPNVFYNHCTTDIGTWATSQLRLQKKTPNPNPPINMPNTAMSYIYGLNDHVIYPEYSRYIAKNVLGIEPIELTTADHSPFLSAPEELANILAEI